MLKLLCVFTLLTTTIATRAQVRPKENSTINYRLTGFSIPKNEKAAYYLLEVAEGTNNNDTYFRKNRIISDTSASNQIIALLPALGQNYTWRISCLNAKYKVKKRSPLYHLATGTVPYADTAQYRLQILTPDTTHKNLYILLDATRTMYDAATGLPVWYLPDIPGLVDKQTAVRDLKPTPYGTFTMLAGDKPCEVNYEGQLLWQAPDDGKISGDTSEFYHHEFTRLHSGRYMVAGSEHLPWPDEKNTNTDPVQQKRRRGGDNKALCGTLIEYDSTGKVTWHWKSSTYFTYNDLFSRMPGTNVMAKTHLNAFYFDEAHNSIYVSFRDVSRVVKIAYPGKEILAAYGEASETDENRQGNGFFYSQHNCRVSPGGEFYLFNNNAIMKKGEDKRADNKTALIIMREPANENERLEKIWDFSCNIDTFASPKSLGGGSILQLADGSFLSSMGTVNRVFIVSRSKQILWNALVQMNAGTTWEPFPSYRASAIETRADLEKLIFNTRNNQNQ